MNGRRTRPARWAAFGLLVAMLGLVAGGCTGDDGAAGTDIEGLGSSLAEIQRLARQEGELNLVVWPDDAHETWAVPFERQTGCDVRPRVATTPAELGNLLESGGWDGVSASGDAGGRLIAEGEVAPLETALIPNYGEIQDGMKDKPFNSRDGQPYGVPHGRAPDLLLFRTDVLSGDTDSWAALWDAPRRYRGRLSVPDDPMVIANVALYLGATRPELGIDDPYELDRRQLRAAVRLLRRQARSIGRYWPRDLAGEVQPYVSGESVVGVGWPIQVELLEQEGAPVQAVKPKEGTTGWSDTWMVAGNAENPNCAYLWLDYVVSPQAQASIADTLGLAPVNLAACELTEDPDRCTELHADDEAWWEDVHYRTTPALGCDGDRLDVCTSYEDWAAAWASVKAPR